MLTASHAVMKPLAAALAALTFLSLFAGCDSEERPGSATGDGSVMTDRPLFMSSDKPAMDRATPDGSTLDGTTDGTTSTETGAPDAGADAAQPDIVDAPMSLPVFCTNVSDMLMTGLAVRFATCAREAPQTTLNRFFDPRYWESGPLARRACPAPGCPGCPALFACAATARSCSEIMSSCLKYSVVPAMGGTCGSTAPSCMNEARDATRCENNLTILDRCEATGGRCVASSTASVCAPESADMCPPDAPARCVVGNVLQNCVAGVYVPVRDCGRNVGLCESARNDCVGGGDTCTGDATSCDGTRLRVCRNGRYQFLDCGQFVRGSTCQTTAGHSFCGFASECDPTTAAANGTCDGSTLVLCAGGRQSRFECGTSSSTGAGFRGCGPTGCIPDN